METALIYILILLVAQLVLVRFTGAGLIDWSELAIDRYTSLLHRLRGFPLGITGLYTFMPKKVIIWAGRRQMCKADANLEEIADFWARRRSDKVLASLPQEIRRQFEGQMKVRIPPPSEE